MKKVNNVYKFLICICVAWTSLHNLQTLASARTAKNVSVKMITDSENGFIPADSSAGPFCEIYEWIDQIKFSRPKKNIARDFSDAVLMAELLKRYYPKNVDVHNYVAVNSVAKKIDNWCMLNRKVLSKINIKLEKEMIHQLACSQPGIIEKVLTDLRTKILKDCNADRESLYSSHEDEMMKSVLNPDEMMNKTIPRHIFVRLKQELQEKDGKICTMQQKISHLEAMMKLKDQRINDLTAQITGLLE